VTTHPHRPFPILIGSRDVYRGRVISLRVDDVEVSPGRNVAREVVDHPGAVVVVAADADGSLLWVRQYRYAAGRALLELPAGTVEPPADPETTARRELAEETGFEAATWQRLGGFFSAPGFCNEYLTAYAARDLTPATGFHQDEDEDIELERLSLEESLRRLDAGEIEDAKSIAALHLYLRHQNR
jgi:ADP-ribose pyrophosphatase